MIALAFLALGLAALPAALFALNLFAYRRIGPDNGGAARVTPVSILIPARNEAPGIEAAVRAALAASSGPTEVIVLDDHSTDDTAARVTALAAEDARVRLITGDALPEGWCGKPFACWQLARAARHPYLLFVDADVRLAKDAATRLAAHLDARPALHLLSGVPRQKTGTLLEKLLIPLIHIVLLGYLPLPAARRFRWTAFAAGCGQLFLARREAYFAAGGHGAVRASLHDGIKLPRAFRAANFNTDLVDATDLATCRMYSSSREVWRGLSRNATEAMAHPAAILPWTVLLLGGHVLPWCLAATAWFREGFASRTVAMALIAGGLSLLPRIFGLRPFSHSRLGLVLHPVSVLLLVAIQWQALGRRLVGRPSTWRGRAYSPSRATAPDRTPSSPPAVRSVFRSHS